MKRITAAFALFMALNAMTTANELTITLEITGVKVNGGDVYIAVYDSAEALQANARCAEFRYRSDSGVVYVETRLSEGFYQVSVFQDENGNGSLDTGKVSVNLGYYKF